MTREEMDKLTIGDAVERDGERWIFVMYGGSRERLFQPAKKDGTAHRGRSLQNLCLENWILADVFRPCPFCGCRDVEYGVASCMSMAAKCCGCRARIEREFPYFVPKGVRMDDPGNMHEDIAKHMRPELLKLWNARARS